jgi:hypothetical protein
MPREQKPSESEPMWQRDWHDAPLPEDVDALMRAYAVLLHKALPGSVHGIYLYGSLALGGYEPGRSDIDFVTVLERRPDADEVKRMRAMHRRLRRDHPLATRLDGIYLPLAELGKSNPELPPYPYCDAGAFWASGHWDANAVTWWAVKHRGITVAGPPPRALPFDASWDGVERAMGHNLTVVWPREVGRRSAFARDADVQFAVLTLCRIHATLAQGAIVSKRAGAEHALASLPSRWHRLIEEAVRLRDGAGEPSCFQSRDERARETRQFVEWMITEYQAGRLAKE